MITWIGHRQQSAYDVLMEHADDLANTWKEHGGEKRQYALRKEGYLQDAQCLLLNYQTFLLVACKPNSLIEFAVLKAIPASVDTTGHHNTRRLIALNRFYTRLTLDGDWDNEAG
ncbi:Cytochrome P450 monooxygenase TRI13 [Fusarium oxysporum f. sp. albedinis]|nr:Cytochrome P450 monooxygenase TRI13 [Fusarium oxysporum f. sp. albedinis]